MRARSPTRWTSLTDQRDHASGREAGEHHDHQHWNEKLLDFGLAKRSEGGGHGPLSQMLTDVDLTSEGTILGTVQYMSPEQLEGREADYPIRRFCFRRDTL